MRESNRINSWRPEITGFPAPLNPSIRGHIYDLHIYIAKLDDGTFWAGWFQTSRPEHNWSVDNKLNRMFLENEG